MQVDPASVILRLIQTAHGLSEIAEELAQAAISVDEPAAAAAHAAALHFQDAAMPPA